MKLVKMSLAAIVAAGALTSVASATPLEEAIKNVDVSGFARYRFDSTKVDANGNQGSDTKASHRFTKPSRKAPSFSYGDIRLSQKN